MLLPQTAALQPNTQTVPFTEQPSFAQQQLTVKITNEMIRTMMINEVGPTMLHCELHFDSIISSFHSTYAKYIENVSWWHVDLRIDFKGMWNHINRVRTRSSQDTLILHMHLLVGTGSSASLLGSSIINIWMPKENKSWHKDWVFQNWELSGSLKTKHWIKSGTSWPENENVHLQFKHILNCTDALVQRVDPTSQLMRDDPADGMTIQHPRNKKRFCFNTLFLETIKWKWSY